MSMVPCFSYIDSPFIKQTVCKVLNTLIRGKYLVTICLQLDICKTNTAERYIHSSHGPVHEGFGLRATEAQVSRNLGLWVQHDTCICAVISKKID